MVTRHQFLTALHDLLRPVTYLEIGVQFGLSLDLAVHSEVAIGIDPDPQVRAKGSQILYHMTSDRYFSPFQSHAIPNRVDLAFIDGSHLFEDVLNDFINIEALCHQGSVVVLDDVLPYNQEIAQREMPPGGDWAGDAWKVPEILAGFLVEHYNMAWVDTFPTGTFVVWGFPGAINNSIVDLKANLATVVDVWRDRTEVPGHVINRTMAFQAQDITDILARELHP